MFYQFDEYYHCLPMGIIVINQKQEAVYTNAAYCRLFGVKMTTDLDQNVFHLHLLAGIRKNRNKTHGTIRMRSDDESAPNLQFDLYINEFDAPTPASISNKSKLSRLRVCTLIPVDLKQHFIESKDSKHLIFDDLRIYLKGEFAKFKNKVIPFSKTEFQLLAYLCAHEDELVSKEELLKGVWKKRSLNTRTVDIYISRVRKKLKQAGCTSLDLHTQHGQGYGLFINRMT